MRSKRITYTPRVLTDLAPEVMRALWERVAGRRRRYPGVPPSGVALPEAPGIPWMTVSMLAPVAQMEALRVFFCIRWCIGEMSSTMATSLDLVWSNSWEISVCVRCVVCGLRRQFSVTSSVKLL